MSAQSALTITVPVRAGREDDLRTLLESIGRDAAGNELIPFGRLTRTHFARLLMLEAAEDLDGRPIAAQLVYMSDVDGALGDHLDELQEVAGDGLDVVLRHCADYPPQGRVPRRRQRTFLEEHRAGESLAWSTRPAACSTRAAASTPACASAMARSFRGRSRSIRC